MSDKSSAMPRGCYRDPLLVLLGAEAKTCAGCRFERVQFNAAYCGLGKTHGRSCRQFSEVEYGKG